MKKLYILTGLVAGLLCATSCDDYLDRTPDDKTTEQQVFTRYDKVESLVTDLYAHAKYAQHPLIYFSHFSLSSISMSSACCLRIPSGVVARVRGQSSP